VRRLWAARTFTRGSNEWIRQQHRGAERVVSYNDPDPARNRRTAALTADVVEVLRELYRSKSNVTLGDLIERIDAVGDVHLHAVEQDVRAEYAP
jgi:hypothetical protein